MKTLQGVELEGYLLTLYRYQFAPDGNEIEADLIAQSAGLQDDFCALIELQRQCANLTMTLIGKTLTQSTAQYAAEKSNLPTNFLMIYIKSPLGSEHILTHHANNNEYLFPCLNCALPIRYFSDPSRPPEFDKEHVRSKDLQGNITKSVPIDCFTFPEHLKTHPYYLQSANAIRLLAWIIFKCLKRYDRIINYTQVLIKSNHPLVEVIDYSILH